MSTYSFPVSQNLQLTEGAKLCSWYMPMAHVSHSVALVLNIFPAEQWLQLYVTEICSSWNFPVEHSTHLCATSGASLPASQVLQEAEARSFSF